MGRQTAAGAVVRRRQVSRMAVSSLRVALRSTSAPGRDHVARGPSDHPSPFEIQSFTRRSRSAFPITDTELNVIAALAMIGLSRMPATGYSAPAAMGTPSAL